MDWARDLPSWPMAHLSQRITGPVHQWHVQEAGSGPCLLLLHGAGASTHTWRGLLPLLAQDFRTIAIDLPGQGFSRLGARNRCGLTQMSHDVARLCTAQGWRPDAIIGHSAGGALALCLSQHMPSQPQVIGLNPALGHFDGVAGWLFPLLAKLLAMSPLTALAFSAGGPNTSRARRLIEGTGSTLDAEGIACYARLLADRQHVDGTLKMMAQWTVDPLLDRLGSIENRCLFINGEMDRAVSPQIPASAAQKMPHASVVNLPGLGHLAHEENAEKVYRIASDWISQTL